jgi:hypothetical protein
MEDEIVDLSEEKKEEPWCTTCLGFTDYRRKWTTVSRADLDGGAYSENMEIPHCVTCGSVMQYLKNCKRLVFGVRMLLILFILLSAMVFFYLYDPSVFSLLCLSVCLLAANVLNRLPRESRRALWTHKVFMRGKELRDAKKILKADKDITDLN